MKINKIEGLIAAPFTPMLANGEINSSIIPEYANKLKADNVKGVFICGTTGEGMFLTVEERMIIAEKWMKEQTNNFRVIVHVGTTSSKQSNALAAHAEKIGANSIGSMGPVFLSPSSVEELVGFCSEIAKGAKNLPFYYYHIPSVSGVNLSMSSFIKKACDEIPNLAGIKFTDNNFMEMQKCMDLDNGKWDILHGYDEMLLAGLSFGAKGAVGSTYNFMATLYNAIIDDFNLGDIESARQKQMKSVKIIDILLKYGGALTSGKALMQTVGIDCGGCRYPLNSLTKNNYQSFICEMKEVGFYDE